MPRLLPPLMPPWPPSTASDIGRTAAGLVFLGDRLCGVVTAYRTARFANRLVKQNFAIAALYNLIAVPVAVAGPRLAAGCGHCHVIVFAYCDRERHAPAAWYRRSSANTTRWPMNGLMILIPVALFLGALGLGAFIWALRSGSLTISTAPPSAILKDDDDEKDS